MGDGSVRIPAFDLARVFTISQQIADLQTQDVMHEIWGYFSQWAEHKFAKVEARVRQSEKLARKLMIAKKENVDIYGAWLIQRFITAAEEVFYTQ